MDGDYSGVWYLLGIVGLAMLAIICVAFIARRQKGKPRPFLYECRLNGYRLGLVTERAYKKALTTQGTHVSGRLVVYPVFVLSPTSEYYKSIAARVTIAPTPFLVPEVTTWHDPDENPGKIWQHIFGEPMPVEAPVIDGTAEPAE